MLWSSPSQCCSTDMEVVSNYSIRILIIDVVDFFFVIFNHSSHSKKLKIIIIYFIMMDLSLNKFRI
jgi:hypothetical protein